MAATFVAFVLISLAAGIWCQVPVLKLNSGHSMPAFGLGTWLRNDKVVKDEVEEAVSAAIDAGYRHIDTAYIYFDEDQVGRAINKKIAEGVVKREDIFLTTKLWNDRHERSDVVPALKESLARLHLDYVDLYLVHWPIAEHKNHSYSRTEHLDTWQGMIEARDLGLAKSIGLSNFNEKQLARVVDNSSVKPAVLQIEVNLNLQQPGLREYCRKQGIAVTGYTPFGSLFPTKAKPDAPPPRVDDPDLLRIAQKYKKTVPQVVLRYLVELGVVPIPKSVSKARIQQNLDVFDFELTQQERDQLKSYDRGYRSIDAKMWAQSPDYPFN